MNVTALMVKELRDKSGAGMMDAKKALLECHGNMSDAVDWLRTKGLAKAAKKSGRTAAEGLICINSAKNQVVGVEINSETDFVAKNSEFQELVQLISEQSLGCNSIEELRAKQAKNNLTVEDLVSEKIATIGEHLALRRLKSLSGKNVYFYVHNSVSKNMGKIAVAVSLSKDDAQFGKNIAMHIAASNPIALAETDLSLDLIEKEKSILYEQARESGKPENIVENMVKGKIRKFYEEVTLLNQKFVLDPDVTVIEAAQSKGVEILSFFRLEVGEGIEKKDEDFAAEVAKSIGN